MYSHDDNEFMLYCKIYVYSSHPRYGGFQNNWELGETVKAPRSTQKASWGEVWDPSPSDSMGSGGGRRKLLHQDLRWRQTRLKWI